jgi:catechol 2,3-dioxygenase-like lactoylglutathione lyase family enzyme
MLHHVALEVRPEEMADEGRFWLAAGFEAVPAPPALGEGFSWYEREGTQIHLMETDNPAAPPRRGHVAVVSGDIDATVGRLLEAGFEVKEGRQLWGERRVKVKTPAGHLVEIMAAPPAPATEQGS